MIPNDTLAHAATRRPHRAYAPDAPVHACRTNTHRGDLMMGSKSMMGGAGGMHHPDPMAAMLGKGNQGGRPIHSRGDARRWGYPAGMPNSSGAIDRNPLGWTQDLGGLQLSQRSITRSRGVADAIILSQDRIPLKEGNIPLSATRLLRIECIMIQTYKHAQGRKPTTF